MDSALLSDESRNSRQESAFVDDTVGRFAITATAAAPMCRQDADKEIDPGPN
jgi:hypothetical protein